MPSAAAARAAAARQPRRLVAGYYQAAAAHFGIANHHRAARVAAVRWEPSEGGDGQRRSGDGGTAAWSVQLDDGSPPLRAHSL
eukprot:3208971-Prymnesium_polylepis.1